MMDHDLDLFEPETLLPGQIPRTGRAWSPEERLCLAVLEISWRDLQGCGPQGDGGKLMSGRRVRLAREARFWFQSPLDSPFSYIWCCHALGYEPRRMVLPPLGAVRRGWRGKPGGYGTRVLARLQKAAEVAL